MAFGFEAFRAFKNQSFRALGFLSFTILWI